MLPLLLAAQLAHAGWTPLDEAGGCRYLRGAREASGATPIRVECDWGFPPAVVHRVIDAPGEHHRIFASLSQSETLSRSGGVERVRQVHHATGISDREVVVEVRTSEIPGGRRYAWQKSADQSGRKVDGVEPEMTVGFWEVIDREGGVRVVYEVRYLAGGSVPAFLVRWFQGSGIQGVMKDLHRHLGQVSAAEGGP